MLHSCCEALAGRADPARLVVHSNKCTRAPVFSLLQRKVTGVSLAVCASWCVRSLRLSLPTCFVAGLVGRERATCAAGCVRMPCCWCVQSDAVAVGHQPRRRRAEASFELKSVALVFVLPDHRSATPSYKCAPADLARAWRCCRSQQMLCVFCRDSCWWEECLCLQQEQSGLHGHGLGSCG